MPLWKSIMTTKFFWIVVHFCKSIFLSIESWFPFSFFYLWNRDSALMWPKKTKFFCRNFLYFSLMFFKKILSTYVELKQILMIQKQTHKSHSIDFLDLLCRSNSKGFSWWCYWSLHNVTKLKKILRFIFLWIKGNVLEKLFNLNLFIVVGQ